MCASPTAERRQHVRYPLAMSVYFQHVPSGREFPARCVDISAGGLLLYVPAAVPVRAGHAVTLTLEGIKNPLFTDLSGRVLHAQVVGVDRRALTTMGHLAMRMKFEKGD